MVIVTQFIACFDALQAFVDAWRPYAAQTYDARTTMPACGPFEVRTQDEGASATAYVWLEPR